MDPIYETSFICTEFGAWDGQFPCACMDWFFLLFHEVMSITGFPLENLENVTNTPGKILEFCYFK